MQKPMPQINSHHRYRKIAIALFAIGVISSGIGTILLSSDFIQVYSTVNHFIPQIVGIEKSDLGDDDRRLVVELNVENAGSRSILIEQYGITIYLNGEYIVYDEGYPDRNIEPFTNDTFSIQVDVTSVLVDTILDAEVSGHWNWEISYPMRLSVSWLYLIPGYQGSWEGVTEV